MNKRGVRAQQGGTGVQGMVCASTVSAFCLHNGALVHEETERIGWHPCSAGLPTMVKLDSVGSSQSHVICCSRSLLRMLVNIWGIDVGCRAIQKLVAEVRKTARTNQQVQQFHSKWCSVGLGEVLLAALQNMILHFMGILLAWVKCCQLHSRR